jgi:predicted DNA-binding transcriptional regulator YafY
MNSVYKSQKQRNQSMGREFGKIRVIAVYRMILENDVITARQIIKNLQERYGIVYDRKTIYSDIAAIDHFIPIDVQRGVKGGYRKHIFEE